MIPSISTPDDRPAEAGKPDRREEGPTAPADPAPAPARASSRRVGRRVTLAAAGLILVALGWLAWIGTRRTPVSGHRQAAARGRAYLDRGRPDLALGAVMDIRDEAPGSGEAMTVAGLALIKLEQYQAARLALERAVKLEPDQFDAVMTLAELNLGFGNVQRALELLESAAQLRPREFRVWYTMGKVLNDRGESSRAIYVYEKAVELDPSHRDALIALISSQVRSDRPEQAEPYVARALQRYPDDPAVLGLAARAAYNGRRFDEALSLADRALAREPRDVPALLARALTRVARSEWPRALPDAEAAVAAQPNEMQALNLLLKIEMHLKLTRRAAATLARRERSQERLRQMNEVALEIVDHPQDPRLPWKMGELATESGMTLLASRCYLAALALDPQYQPARQSLAKLQAAHPELATPRGQPIPGAGASPLSSGLLP
jgi:tetratricopeptide (TPR) repeat protein